MLPTLLLMSCWTTSRQGLVVVGGCGLLLTLPSAGERGCAWAHQDQDGRCKCELACVTVCERAELSVSCMCHVHS